MNTAQNNEYPCFLKTLFNPGPSSSKKRWSHGPERLNHGSWFSPLYKCRNDCPHPSKRGTFFKIPLFSYTPVTQGSKVSRIQLAFNEPGSTYHSCIIA